MWNAPENDGGSSLIDYSVEMAESEGEDFIEIRKGLLKASYVYKNAT